MLQLQVDNMIKSDPAALPGFLMQKIEHDLTLDNPAYINAERLGFYTGNLDRHITLYRYQDDKLILPRGYGPDLLKLVQNHKIAWTMNDQRLILPPVDFNSRIKLRDYQKPAVEKLVKHRQGGLVCPPAGGKTEMMLQVIAEVEQPVLWVTHTNELLYQARDRACKSFGIKPEETGIIANGSVNIGKKLTVSLIQTLHKADLQGIVGQFGCVVVDEGHHAAARTFYETINKFPALYRYWCSATPERADGLTKMVYAAGGPVLYEIGLQDLPVIIPDLEVVETEYSGHDENYSKLISDLIRDGPRNRLTVDTIAKEAPGNLSLVLSDRIDHLHTLEATLKEALPGLAVEVLTAKKNAKEREQIMEAAKTRQVDVLLATQLAREGLDLPHLNRLFLCTPKRATGAVQQEVGRIMRPHEGKRDAVVFDFWDSASPILKAQFWRRREVYRKLGMDLSSSKKPSVYRRAHK